MRPVDPALFASPGSFDGAVTHARFVPAAPGAVYDALTTAELIEAWLGVPATVDPTVGGRYELLFDPTQPAGLQGSEGCQVLALLPGRMLTVTWNSPPSLSEIRGSLTFVVFMLRPDGDGSVVELTHAGHGDGEIWNENRRYFERAWGLVLDALAKYFEH